jgi:hypothetical protein
MSFKFFFKKYIFNLFQEIDNILECVFSILSIGILKNFLKSNLNGVHETSNDVSEWNSSCFESYLKRLREGEETDAVLFE